MMNIRAKHLTFKKGLNIKGQLRFGMILFEYLQTNNIELHETIITYFTLV